LGSATWGSDGIFVDNKFQILPKSIGIECAATIFPSKFYQFGIVHTKDGEVSLYLDGYQCATGSPKENKGFVLDANDVYFLHSDTGKHSAGYVNRIRLWDHALTNKEMASASGCSLTQEGFTSTCDDPPAVFVPRYSKYKYSSVYSNNDVGTGYGRGRLDSPQVCELVDNANVWGLYTFVGDRDGQLKITGLDTRMEIGYRLTRDQFRVFLELLLRSSQSYVVIFKFMN
jgi:hypothetical protein